MFKCKFQSPKLKQLAFALCALVFSNVAFGTTSFLKGINLDQTFETRIHWNDSPAKEDFELLEALGFNAVRIPFSYFNHLNSEGVELDKQYKQRLRETVLEFRRRNFFVIVDLHDKRVVRDLGNDPTRLLSKIWREVAVLFRDQDQFVAFDLLNEPSTLDSASDWIEIQSAVTAEIESISPYRQIILSGAQWSSVDRLLELEPPTGKQNQSIFKFHFYDPMWFTHQGAYWLTDRKYPPNQPWTPSQLNTYSIRNNFRAVRNWMEKQRTKVIVGEFGVIDKAPLNARAEWIKFIRKEAELNTSGWFIWSYQGDFGIFDRQRRCVVAPLVAALFDIKRELPVGSAYCED